MEASAPLPAESKARPMTVTGVFRNTQQVERAYETAVARGYVIGDVNVVMSEETRHRLYAEPSPVTSEIGKKSAEGAELGGPTGGRVGIAISIVAAVGAALVLPGLGLVAAGPIAVALAGAGAAGLAAALISALADWGLPEERLREYERAIGDGGILMGVRTRSLDDAQQIAMAWKEIGGQQVHS
jgi:hypothetical protein